MLRNNNSYELSSPQSFGERHELSSSRYGRSTGWVPPNDRELIIRAKLKTGWSTRNPKNFNSNSSSESSSTCSAASSTLISDLEFLEIEQVMQRAAMIEQKEINRINKLYERWNSLNRPQGNGKTNCLICNCIFGMLENTPKICTDCLKNVCPTCSIETLNIANPKQFICLCKICAEYREFLKKSGAWFNKRLPNETGLSDSPSLLSISPLLNVTPKHSGLMLTKLDVATPVSCEAVPSPTETEHSTIKESPPPPPPPPQQDESSSDEEQTELPVISNVPKLSYTRSSLADLTKSFASNPISLAEPKSIEMGSVPNLNLLKDHIAMSKNAFSTCNQSGTSRSASIPNKSFNHISLINLTNQNISKLQPVANSLGTIQFNVEYIQSLQQLRIYLKSARGLMSCDSNGLSDPYVKLHLLPGIAKATKLRSKTVYKNLNPHFNETLQYDGITLFDLDSKTLRLTVLDEDKFGFDFIGEYRLPLNTLILNEVNEFDVELEAKQEHGDEDNLAFRGKINLALKYSKLTNCLYVKINKCRHLLPMDHGKTSDPFVEISLLPACSQKENKQKFKTSTKKKTLDPDFYEEFKFLNIDLKSLLSRTIEIDVWDRDFGSKNDYIGSVSLGQERTGDELKHFFTMVKNTEIYHEAWHTLQLKHPHDESKL